MLQEKLLPTAQSVASNAAGSTVSTAIFPLEIGKTYHEIWLDFSDANGTPILGGNAINEIRLLIDGHVQRKMTAKELNALNSLMGQDYAIKTSGTIGTAGFRQLLPIFLAEPWRQFRPPPGTSALPGITEGQMLAWSINPADIAQSFTMEVDIQPGLTSPNLKGFYYWDALQGRRLGNITKWLRSQFNCSGTTNDFNIARRDFIHSIHIFPDADGHFVNSAQLTANGAIIKDLTDAIATQSRLIARDMNPDVSATPRFDLVLDADDHLDGTLLADGLNELTLKLNYSGSSSKNMPYIIQRTGPRE